MQGNSRNNSDAIRLGLMPPFTGIVGIYGPEIARAGKIACQEINEDGGVLGRPLELIIEDDGSLPESAVAAAEKLVDHYYCSAIIGNLLSNSRIAVAYRVAEPRKIPLLNFSFYEGSILSRYFFHYAALPNQQIDRMVPYMRKQYGPRMFFAGHNYEWPRGSVHAAKEALKCVGGEVVGEEYLQMGVDDGDIDQLLDAIENASPDVFVPYFAGEDQVKLLTRFSERGMKDRMAVVMGHYDEMMASQLLPEVRNGFYSSNTYFMSVDTSMNKKFLKHLSQQPDVDDVWPKGNGILTNFGEGAYVCVKAFAKAANKAGSLETEALLEALKTNTISAPQGAVTMNPDHQHAEVNAYLSRCEEDGSFTIIEEFGCIEPSIPTRYSHQKIIHQTAIESDIRLQARMLEQMTEAILLVSMDEGLILYSNASVEKLFGYEKSEINGLPIARVIDSSDGAPQFSVEKVVEILNKKGEWNGDLHHFKKDGSTICCSAKITSFTHPLYGEVWLSVHRDISNERRVNQKLNVQSSIIDQIHDSVISTDLEGFITSWNNGSEKLFGFTVGEMLGKHISGLYPKDQHKFLIDEVIAPLRENGQHEVEVKMLPKSGHDFYGHLSMSMIYDENGDAINMVCFTQDITDRKKSEIALMESEKRFRLINSRFPGILYQFKIDNMGNQSLPYCSPTVEKYIGLSADVVMADVTKWFSLTHPDDLPGLEGSINKSLETLNVWDWEGRFICFDGQVRWLHGTSIPVRQGDGSTLWDGLFIDVTERRKVGNALKKSEELHEKAQEISSIGHWEFIPATGAVTGSDEFFHIFGLSRDDISIEKFVGVVHPDDREMDVAAIQRGVEYGESWDIKHRLICHDGTEKWVHALGEATTDKEGSVTELIGTVQDITEHVLLENELENYRGVLETLVDERTAELSEARDEAERSNHAKSDFLSRMSHELRTPLNAILGFGQMLELDQEDFNENQQGNVQEILEAGRHLLHLINEVLDLAKVESGKFEVTLSNVSVDDLLTKCLALIHTQADERNLEIINHISGKGYTVLADSTGLKQVMVNLLSNAVKYNREQGSILLDSEIINSQYLRLSVTDCGKGLSSDNIAKLFTAFERLNKDNNVVGTGIGLFISKHLMELMGGDIGVKSTPGKGSTFWLDIELIK